MTRKTLEVRSYPDLPDEARFIRTSVFMEEQGYKEEFDDIDGLAYHVVAYRGGKAVGTGRVYPDPEHEEIWHIGRVAVIMEERGGGTGSELLQALEEVAASFGAETFVLSAQQRVQPFYEKNGYEAEGVSYLDEGVPHIVMRKHRSCSDGVAGSWVI